MPQRSRIIVVLPAYNEEANIGALPRRTFEAVTGEQTDFSILVVDDESSDRTCEILEDAARDLPLHVRHHERNQGLAMAFRATSSSPWTSTRVIRRG